MQRTTLVLMTKQQLDLYLDLLDNRIAYLKSTGCDHQNREYQDYLAMRHHAYAAKEFFR